MTASDSAWLNFFSDLAIFGCIMVFIGVALEGAEIIVKLGTDMKCRRWVVKKFGKDKRRTIVFCAKYIKPRLLPFELLAFGVLVFGLAIEILGSFSAERLQSKANSELSATNAVILLQVEQLRSTNFGLSIELEKLKLPRTIKPEQKKDS
jgi:hypothetical protein